MQNSGSPNQPLTFPVVYVLAEIVKERHRKIAAHFCTKHQSSAFTKQLKKQKLLGDEFCSNCKEEILAVIPGEWRRS
ncbi:hypothetical protein INT45_008278 [Circinella minor]|uniref:Uncharacterized protein n=1 Tax=Circinella minor TaxID=1195481 RepID=A0A8H7VCT1_9FUNG|nr:hypothetical protein INT45_008278 [Circinella minor]